MDGGGGPDSQHGTFVLRKLNDITREAARGGCGRLARHTKGSLREATGGRRLRGSLRRRLTAHKLSTAHVGRMQ
jgi:hypothetical protein